MELTDIVFQVLDFINGEMEKIEKFCLSVGKVQQPGAYAGADSAPEHPSQLSYPPGE